VKNTTSSAADNTPAPDPKGIALKLLKYCSKEDFAGYDPYDALNSPCFDTFSFADRRVFRLALTQALKRSPVNVRSLLKIPKTKNPKALALFLVAFLKLSKLELLREQSLIKQMIEQLVILRALDSPYWCWGYSFAWQTRTIVVPKGAPNLVCTTFVANALLDAFVQLDDATLLEMATSAGEYILKVLYYTEGDEIAAFSYPLPHLQTKIHNANFLGAALLARLFYHTGDDRMLEAALRVARYSASKQKNDGSWDYGESPSQQWIDNFHTGYNLSALRSVGRYGGTREFDGHVAAGFKFYRSRFFREDGAVRYYHDRTYPIDIHCVAQSLLTLIEFEDLVPENADLIRTVYAWAIKHMWDESGFFYYRVLRTLTIRTSYMRWSQAWMLLALATLLEHEAKHARHSSSPYQATIALA